MREHIAEMNEKLNAAIADRYKNSTMQTAVSMQTSLTLLHWHWFSNGLHHGDGNPHNVLSIIWC